MKIKVLHNHNCSKSRGLLEHLNLKNISYEIINIIESPLSEIEISTVLKKLNLDVHSIIRKEDVFFKENFGNIYKSEEEWITILSENPTMIQRPILIKNSKAIIARPLEKVDAFLNEE